MTARFIRYALCLDEHIEFGTWFLEMAVTGVANPRRTLPGSVTGARLRRWTDGTAGAGLRNLSVLRLQRRRLRGKGTRCARRA